MLQITKDDLILVLTGSMSQPVFKMEDGEYIQLNLKKLEWLGVEFRHENDTTWFHVEGYNIVKGNVDWDNLLAFQCEVID